MFLSKLFKKSSRLKILSLGLKTVHLWEIWKATLHQRLNLLYFFQKGRRLINGKRDSNVFEYKKTGNKLHPTQKSVDMTEYMLSKFSDEGDTILDPFMGSGTTGVACVNTNRNFIGMELDEDYFKIAEKRINDTKH